MVVYQPKRIKFGIIARSRAYGQFGCLVSTRQNCQTSFLKSHRKRKSLHNKGCLSRKYELLVIISVVLISFYMIDLNEEYESIILWVYKIVY